MPSEPVINVVDDGKTSGRRAYLDDLRHSTGAEQERYASHFTWKRPDGTVETVAPPVASRAGRDSPFSLRPTLDTTAVGILRSTLLPSLGLQSGLAVIAYGGARLSDRVEGKDWLWPSSQIINAWWSLVGSRVISENIDASTAWSGLVYPEKLILGGVTLWGSSLLYRVVSRSLKGEDPEYTSQKSEPDFWNKAFFTSFLPVAGFQSLISLPFILPFRATHANVPAPIAGGSSELAHGLGVFLFSTGFALEVLADKKLAKNEEKSSEGVWSISERPNYLGDMLVHSSFPLILYGAGILHPLAFLGPIANFAFLRYKDKKADQASLWPSTNEVQNSYMWGIVTVGIAASMLERVFRSSTRY